MRMVDGDGRGYSTEGSRRAQPRMHITMSWSGHGPRGRGISCSVVMRHLAYTLPATLQPSSSYSCLAPLQHLSSLSPFHSRFSQLAGPGPINTFREMTPLPPLHSIPLLKVVRQESINNSQYVQREMRSVWSAREDGAACLLCLLPSPRTLRSSTALRSPDSFPSPSVSRGEDLLAVRPLRSSTTLKPFHLPRHILFI